MNAPQQDVPSVPMQPVTSSSNVSAWGYDIPRQELYVEFKGGSTYRYRNVPHEVAIGWAEAESKGKYFLKEVKPKFLDFTKLAPKPEPEAENVPPPRGQVMAPAPGWPFPSSGA